MILRRDLPTTIDGENAPANAIAARAASLRDRDEDMARLAAEIESPHFNLSPRALRWCETAAGGDLTALARRVQWHETEDTSRRWVSTLQALLAFDPDQEDSYAHYSVDDDLPFAPLLTPMLQVAHKLLRDELRPALHTDNGTCSPTNGQDQRSPRPLSQSAYCCLLASLAERLGDCCTNVLFAEFEESRPSGPGLVRLLTEDSRAPATTALSPVFSPADTGTFSTANASDGFQEDTEAIRVFRQSVLRTGLLPTWQFTGKCDGASVDITALGITANETDALHFPTWLDVNTDAMRRGLANVTVGATDATPRHNGEIVRADNHIGEIVAGFEAMYAFLQRQTGQLLAEDGPLEYFRGVQARYLFRSTKTYIQTLLQASTAACLRDGIDRGIEIDAVSRAAASERTRPEIWPLVVAERGALDQLDIPYFRYQTDETGLHLDTGETVADLFAQSGFDAMR